MKDKSAPLIYRFARAVLCAVFRVLYRCEFRGLENIPLHGSVLLVSSHVSAIDPILLGYACKRQVHYMAKESLFNKKLFGWALRLVGAFPVKRGTGGEDALNEAYEVLEKEKVIGIFIEGTRSKDGQLGKPKTGPSLLSYKTGAIVVPVSIIAQGGTKPKKFKKTMLYVGKPLTSKDLGIDEDTSMHYRRGAKAIMAEIAKLREEAIETMEK